MRKRAINITVAILIAVMLLISAIPLIAMISESSVGDHIAYAAAKVYYAAHSKKYHRTKRCRTLRRSKKIYSTTVKKAKKKGLKKCKVCY